MERVAEWILNHAKAVVAAFSVLFVIGIFTTLAEPINYNLADYVPDDAASTRAIKVMNEEFQEAAPNLRVYVPNVSISKALAIKQQIAEIPRIQAVMWLDDMADIRAPLDMADPELVNNFYRDGSALYQVTADLDDSVATVASLRELIGDDGALEGQLIDMEMAQHSVSNEMARIMAIMIPAGLLLLCFPTRSWLEPPILLITIGTAVVLNMGTNLMKHDVSFVTAAVTGVLQLAVSMDYGIFLLHARRSALKAGHDRRESLKIAIVKSSNAILAASMTTVLGFLALVFMSFRIGPDLGFVLAKGVVLSLVTVLVLMPSILLLADRWLLKTSHRPFLPSFKRLGHFVGRFSMFGLVILVLLPLAFMAQNHNDFLYGNGEYPDKSVAARDRAFINKTFGQSVPMVLMVPRGDWGREAQLVAQLDTLPDVSSITSFQTVVGNYTPEAVVPNDKVTYLLSKNYSRIILTVTTEKQGDHAFEVVQQVRDIANKWYPDTYLLTGESVVTADMKSVVTRDNLIVNGLAILSVGLVLLISFRSISIPFILVLTIEGAIWLNLSVPYITGINLAYIGYLVISSVQLGATVDYAILYTQHYVANRKHFGRRQSVTNTTTETFGTLLPPAAILTIAGFLLSIISSLEIVSQLGTVLGRGAFISFLLVNLLLPGLLILLDKVIEKTTWRAEFVRSPLCKRHHAHASLAPNGSRR